MTSPTGSNPRNRMRRHLDNLAAAKDAGPDERRRILESARQEARDRRQTRPLPRWLATSANRRAFALLAAVPFVAGAASAYMDPDGAATFVVQAAGAAGTFTGIFMLRRMTRELTERPAAELDERELQDRNQALAIAYMALLFCLFVLAVLGLADGRMFDVASWQPLLLGTIGAAVLLPSAAAAWRWRDFDEEV